MRKMVVKAVSPNAIISGDAALALPPCKEFKGTMSRVAKALEQCGRLFEALASWPVPNERPVKIDTNHDAGDQESLRDLWFHLTPEQQAILRFVCRRQNCVLTYAAIAENITVPRMSDDDRNIDRLIDICDRTVAKHCHPMEQPELGLLRRLGKRKGVQITPKGDRLVRMHLKDDFS